MQIEISLPNGSTIVDGDAFYEAIECLTRFTHSLNPSFTRLLTLSERNRPFIQLNPEAQFGLLCAMVDYKHFYSGLMVGYARTRLTVGSGSSPNDLRQAGYDLGEFYETSGIIDSLIAAVFQHIKVCKKKESCKKFTVRVVLEEVSSDTLLEKIKQAKHEGVRRVDLTAAELALVPDMVKAKKIVSRNILGRVTLIADSELL